MKIRTSPFSLGDVGAMLHVGGDKLRKWIDAGELDATGTPFGWSISADSLMRFLASKQLVVCHGDPNRQPISTVLCPILPDPPLVMDSLLNGDLVTIPRAAKRCHLAKESSLYRLVQTGEVAAFDLSAGTRSGLRVFVQDVQAHQGVPIIAQRAAPAASRREATAPSVEGLDRIRDQAETEIARLEGLLKVQRETLDLVDSALDALDKLAEISGAA